MTVSGTTTFNLDMTEIIEEAYERCGVEVRNGYSMRTARRSLNLLLLEWANRGLNLWTIEERTQALTQDVGSYTLGTDVVDVIEQMVQIPDTGQRTRYNLTRVSVSTHASRTNPDISGRPTEVWYDRQQPAPIAHIWPLPDASGQYTLYYWVLRRLDDVGAYTNTSDVPFRFLPALIAGLAYQLGRKVLTVDPKDGRYSVMFLEQKIVRLAQDYEASFKLAADEDREKATLSITPRGSVYRVA